MNLEVDIELFLKKPYVAIRDNKQKASKFLAGNLLKERGRSNKFSISISGLIFI